MSLADTSDASCGISNALARPAPILLPLPPLRREFDASAVLALTPPANAENRTLEGRPVLERPLRERLVGEVGHALAVAREAFERGEPTVPPEVVWDLSDVAQAIVGGLRDGPVGTTVLAGPTPDGPDVDAHRHALQVAIVGVLVARHHWSAYGWRDARGRTRRDGIRERLQSLGLGLLLHDVGKTTVPSVILEKPAPLTADELQVVQRHPGAGTRMLAGLGLPPSILSTVGDHHERRDRTGYPSGLGAVHEFAQFCSMADIYDAVTSPRPYRKASPPHVAVRAVSLEGLAGRIDRELVASFRSVCPPFPVGSALTSARGRCAEVVAVDHEDPWRGIARCDRPDCREEAFDLRQFDPLRQQARDGVGAVPSRAGARSRVRRGIRAEG